MNEFLENYFSHIRSLGSFEKKKKNNPAGLLFY